MRSFRVNARHIRHIFHRFQNVPASCERSLILSRSNSKMMNLWSRLNLESQWACGLGNVPERRLKPRKMHTFFLQAPKCPGSLLTTLDSPPLDGPVYMHNHMHKKWSRRALKLYLELLDELLLRTGIWQFLWIIRRGSSVGRNPPFLSILANSVFCDEFSWNSAVPQTLMTHPFSKTSPIVGFLWNPALDRIRLGYS